MDMNPIPTYGLKLLTSIIELDPLIVRLVMFILYYAAVSFILSSEH